MDPKQVADLLVRSGRLRIQAAHDLILQTSLYRKRVDTLIFEQKLLSREEFYYGLAEALDIDYYDLLDFEPPPETLKLIPSTLARLHGILPIFSTTTTIFVALADPCNFQGLEELSLTLGADFTQVLGDIDRVDQLIQSYYGSRIQSLEEDLTSEKSGLSLSLLDKAAPFDFTENTNATPIVRLVDLILEKAVQSRASDIHLEPFESEFKIRYRVDGTLYEMVAPPPHLASVIISRIKVLAKLNIAERRLPQDGRIQYVVEGHSVDLRVSTLPTAFGESVVLRVLDRTTVQLDLEMLGFSDEILRSIVTTIHKPNGIFIITGPTGSGKTTTLYSCLRRINTIHSKLLTVEDPVEYEVEGLLQVPVNENIGLSFSRILRAFLRQDPDCIMVGEIRDMETAQIAIQASLTGHFVLTTLHTNDTVGAITRLENLGIEPFLIATSLEGILAQRLVRQTCPHCRVDYRATEFQIGTLGLRNGNFYCGKGCKICNDTGYLGRKGIYEFLPLDNAIRELINARAPEAILRKKAIELGMTTLREDGLRTLYAGDSTIEEIMKYT